MNKKTFPIEEVKELIDQNYKIVEMAKHFNVSRPTMGNFLKENNLKTKVSQKRERAAQVNEQLICSEYEEGKTIRELGIKYQVSDSVIKRCLLNKGMKTRTNSEAHQKYSLDIDYFKDIDTLDKAYLLGFFCADGWVTDRNEFGIALKASDIDMIYFFQKELKTDKPIIYKNNGEAVELRLQNKDVADTLKNYGIVPRKSLIINIEEVIQKAQLNENQIKAFLLGYFDGDGGFTVSKPTQDYPTVQYGSNITGTYETCIYFKKFFNDVGFLTKRHDDEKNNYTYRIGGRNMVRNAFSNLYSIKDKLTFFYRRKYNIFIEM